MPENNLTTPPLTARIMLSHAYFQRLARNHGVDILHIKGYAFGTDIYRPHRYSSDVDLLVRPAHVEKFVRLLLNEGWSIQAHFETGSVFEHAMTLHHPSWGLTDIHRFFPGLGQDPGRAFEQLWLARTTRTIAHRECTVPSTLDARLLVVLHRARAGAKYSGDMNYLNSIMSWADWLRLGRRARELHSSIAYAAATGGLELYRGSRDWLLWKAVSRPHSPRTLWAGRFIAARGTRQKLRTLKNILLVNEDHLAMDLGHSPTRKEIRRRFFTRFIPLPDSRAKTPPETAPAAATVRPGTATQKTIEPASYLEPEYTQAQNSTIYRIAEHIAYIHTEEFAPHSRTASYLADLRTGTIAALEGSASIIWGVFEYPCTLAQAVADAAEIAGQDPENIREQVGRFTTDLLQRGYLEPVDGAGADS